MATPYPRYSTFVLTKFSFCPGDFYVKITETARKLMYIVRHVKGIYFHQSCVTIEQCITFLNGPYTSAILNMVQVLHNNSVTYKKRKERHTLILNK